MRWILLKMGRNYGRGLHEIDPNNMSMFCLCVNWLNLCALLLKKNNGIHQGCCRSLIRVLFSFDRLQRIFWAGVLFEIYFCRFIQFIRETSERALCSRCTRRRRAGRLSSIHQQHLCALGGYARCIERRSRRLSSAAPATTTADLKKMHFWAAGGAGGWVRGPRACAYRKSRLHMRHTERERCR